jgi:hypothetical protein
MASACLCTLAIQPEQGGFEAIVRILPIVVGGMMISSSAWGLIRLWWNEITRR